MNNLCHQTRDRYVTGRVYTTVQFEFSFITYFFETFFYIMPGPRNIQKKRKSNIKPSKKEKSCHVSLNGLERTASDASSSPSSPSPDYPVTPPSQLYDVAPKQDMPIKETVGSVVEEILMQQPYIHDPGNGPRVRDTRAFLESSFFAQLPALDVSANTF